jgi:hypothetical protein
VSALTPARQRIIAAVALLAMFALAFAGSSAAQQPDLNGVWQGPYVPDMSRTGRNQTGEPNLPFTAAGEKEWKSYDAANGDYTGACLPFGLSRSVNAPNPFQIIQGGGYVGFLFEVNNWFHVVPTDGRATPKDPNPQWFGSSVGRWDGDTLIIDTRGFNGWTRLDTIGHPHSDQLHLVQRFSRPDLGHITYEITVEDPKTFTKSWTNTRTFTLRPDWEMMEYSCEENNKSLWEGRIKVPKPPQP